MTRKQNPSRERGRRAPDQAPGHRLVLRIRRGPLAPSRGQRASTFRCESATGPARTSVRRGKVRIYLSPPGRDERKPRQRKRCRGFTWQGAPGEIRTPDLLIRSQTLYPAELRAQK